MKKLLIIIGIAFIASCKKETTITPIAETKTIEVPKYESGVFFRIEDNSNTHDMDSCEIWISETLHGVSYNRMDTIKTTKYGTIKKFNSFDCSGDGLRCQLDTGRYYYQARYYGAKTKLSTSLFVLKKTTCYTERVDPY